MTSAKKQPSTHKTSPSRLDIHRQNIASKYAKETSQKVSSVLNKYSQCTDKELENLYKSRLQEYDSYKWAWIYGHVSEWAANHELLKIRAEQEKRENKKHAEWIYVTVTARINAVFRKIRW